MCHVTDRQSGAFTVLGFYGVVVLALIRSCGGQPEAVGPSRPIVALVGDDVVLPCHLVPATNALAMTVEWARRDLEPRFVMLWRGGVELASKKHPSYRGRTSLSTEGLKRGDVSLKLSSVRTSDEGSYRCFFPELDKAPAVELVVGAVSSPVILMTERAGGGGVLLQCEAAGWYPEPELLWLDGEGNLVPARPAETSRRPDGLYAVSSRLTVEKRRSNFTCRVQQRTANRSRDTHVQVADPSFLVPDTPSTLGSPGARSTAARPHVIIGSIIGCAALVLVPAVLFVVWKRQQKKFKIKRSLEDGAEQTEEGKEVTSSRGNRESQDGECASLLAGKEEESRTEKIESHRETNQDQLVTKPDEDTAEKENTLNSISHEEEPLIPNEGQTQQKQDVMGRQVANEGEGGQTVKPVEEDPGRPLVLVEDRQEEQHQHVHAAQEVRKEEETKQEPVSDKVDKEDTKKKADSGCTEPENDRKLLLETQDRKERQEGEKELKPKNSCLLGDKKQERDAAQDDAKGKDQEAKQSNITDTSEGKEENRKETEDVQNEKKLQSAERENMQKNKKRTRKGVGDQTRDAIKDREGKPSGIERTTERKAENQAETLKESEKTHLNTQEGVLDASQQEAVHGEEEGRDTTSMTEGKPENQTDERGTERPSVGRESTGKPDEDTAEKENKLNSISHEEEPLIPNEGQTQQKQDVMGRQVANKGEGGQTVKPVEEESELVEDRQEEQHQNVHAAQEVRKEEETKQEPVRDKVDMEDTKKKADSGRTEPENDRKLQSAERENMQKGVVDQTRDAIQDREGKPSGIERTTEGKAESQAETLKESEKTHLNTQEGVPDASQQEAVQSQADERGTARPSVGRESTATPDLKIHQETTGRGNPKLHEEPGPQAEKQRKEECEEAPEEGMETEGAVNSERNIKKPAKRRRQREAELHEAEPPSKRMGPEPKEAQVEFLADVNMEQGMDEPQGLKLQLDQAGMFQKDPPEEQMDQ